MTEKIYDFNGNIFEFKANVVKCHKNEKGQYEIVLDKTAFFCGGGGQERDFGKINSIEVIDIYEKDNVIYHILPCEFAAGEEVSCKIDKDFRFRNMQLHSGEHLVSGIIHKIYGYNNVGFHLGKDFVTMDVDGDISKEDLEKVETLANKAIWENVPFKVYYPTENELKNLDYRSKLELTENVRIVEIEGYDRCACCAPHVSFLGQIGIIKLLDVTRINKGSRIRMISGSLAFKDYFEKYENVNNISTLLSVKHSDVYESVLKLKKSLEEKEFEYVGLKRQLLELKYNEIKDKNNIIIFEKEADKKEIPFLISLLKKQNSGIIGVFFGDEEQGYNFALESEIVDLTDIKNGIFSELNGKCGGKKDYIQGFVKEKNEKIEKFFIGKNIDNFIKR